MIITHEQLTNLNACSTAVKDFSDLFGDRTPDFEWTRELQIIMLAFPQRRWLGWLFEVCLPQWSMRGANLSNLNLRGAGLRGADLHGANLRGADLRGADLCGAYLRWANLRGADLHGADLRWANLRGADLHGADLHGADLREAYLHGVINVPERFLNA